METPEIAQMVPDSELLFNEEYEYDLLTNAVENAGSLYELYEARITHIAYLMKGGLDTRANINDFFTQMGRQNAVMKLLPDEDTRSYGARG